MKAHRAFSLVELLAVLGVISILLSLILPAISKSREGARHTSEAVAARSAAAAVEAYCVISRGVYPIASDNAVAASAMWEGLLRVVGVIDADEQVPSMWLSTALVYDPAKMVPGATEWPRLARSLPIQAARVRYPSLKGMLCPVLVRQGADWRPWCMIDDLAVTPMPEPDGAVAFADGSVMRASWYELTPSPWYVPDENGIGIPVITTWYGCYGRDR